MKRAEYHNIHLSARLVFQPECLQSSLDYSWGDLHRLWNLHVFLIFPKERKQKDLKGERNVWVALPLSSTTLCSYWIKKQNRCTFYVVSNSLTHINQQHYMVSAVGNSILQMKKFRQISHPGNLPGSHQSPPCGHSGHITILSNLSPTALLVLKDSA